MREKDHL